MSTRRTPLQDIRFLIDELVEVGTRALSPGVNDPFTAITCLDWLGAALSEAARRKLPSPYRLDHAKDLRVIVIPISFERYVDRAFGNFRQYLASDKNACVHALRTIERLARTCAAEEQLEKLLVEVGELRSAAQDTLSKSLYTPVAREAEKTALELRRLTAR